jgi:hypothetical protein
LFFTTNRLVNVVRKLWQEGVTHFFIDEVHKYPYETWAQELKNIPIQGICVKLFSTTN